VSNERKPTSKAAFDAELATSGVYCQTPNPSIGSSTPLLSVVDGTADRAVAEAASEAKVKMVILRTSVVDSQARLGKSVRKGGGGRA
jgi:hypothetical protein